MTASAFVLIGKPIIVMVIMGLMGYRKRTGFLTGLTVAQISEFSLLLGALGLSLGHVGPETMGLITTVGLATIGLSMYMVNYSGRLYEWLAPWLTPFERRLPYRETGRDAPLPQTADFVVLGLGRYGGGIVRHLLLRDRRVIGVDFDPQALAHWRDEGVPVLYGDASDPELFDHLPLGGVRWVVSTAPDIETSRVLLRHLHARDFGGKIAVACRTADEGDILRLDGVDLLLRPYADAAEQAADALTPALDRLAAVAGETPGLREVRLGSTSRWAGHRIANVPLREEFGATVLAVSRGGRSFFNPHAEFQLFPGDRMILTGDPDKLVAAIEYLERTDLPDQTHEERDFTVEEVSLQDARQWHGQTIAALDVRNRFGISVVAVKRGDRLSAPDPHEILLPNDRLIVAGSPSAISRVREADR
jgi:Trk K+ transport system NAD-binding subunit